MYSAYLNPEELQFTHFIRMVQQRAIYAVARERDGRRTHIFLVAYDGSWIKRRVIDSWLDYHGDDAQRIKDRIRQEFGVVNTIETQEVVVW